MTTWYTVDLHFLGVPQTIAVYLIPHPDGVLLIESGPGSTVDALEQGLAARGYNLTDVTDVLLTHIHLDHAGAAGYLARHGARVHVHPVGAPHMRAPERLLASARRIYGEAMDRLWGAFLPVPDEQLHVPRDEEPIIIGPHTFIPLDTPGHARHHYAYYWEQARVLFTGDIGGVRLPGVRHIRLPMPPPEFHLEQWRASLARLRQVPAQTVVPTHFGPFTDVDWHLAELERLLDEVEAFLERVMPQEPDEATLRALLEEWVAEHNRRDGVSPELHQKYETANPTWMSAAGLLRYWRKFRQGGAQ
ncbi:MAG: MBL fold metallo-hydrolase [Chloroflexi bacterium]|nr:MBL fold metallo-hydrolase [Chloroflexota bacterium]